MTTIDITDTSRGFAHTGRNDQTISFISGNHTRVVLRGSIVPTYVQPDTRFIMLIQIDEYFQVLHNMHNIVENVDGEHQYVLIEIAIDNDSFVVTFGEDFGMDLTIRSDRHGQFLADCLQRSNNTYENPPTDMAHESAPQHMVELEGVSLD